MKSLLIWITLIYLGIASWWDIRERRIPLGLILCGAAAETGLAVIIGIGDGDLSPARMLAGLLPGVFLLILSGLGHQTGPADGMILCAVGIAESYVFALWTLMSACLIMGLISGGGLLLHRMKKEERLPFVPFMTVGYMVCVCLRLCGS
jgi:prepilin signal peptidase PulO-like enzyme (type II secretory pathway)